MTKTEKIPVLGISSPKTILMFRVGLKKKVGREMGITHTFHLSLRDVLLWIEIFEQVLCSIY